MKLHGYWQSGAVIQCDRPYCITGWEETAHQAVASLYSENMDLLEQVTAPVEDGRFSITMSPRQGSFSVYSLEITAGDTVRLENICFGEVFLSSGQSNMEFSLSGCLDRTEAASLYSPYIRYLNSNGADGVGPLDSDRALRPLEDPVQTGWKQADGEETAGAMSAISFYYAAAVLEHRAMPVGVISTAVGGTTVEAWLSREAIDSHPAMVQYLRSQERYRDEMNFNKAGGRNYTQMTALYNERIAPYQGIRVKAVVWLLGESSASDEKETAYFQQAMTALITGWRKLFGEDTPFFVMDIAAENYQFAPMAVPRLNRALAAAAAGLPAVFEAPVYDLPLDWVISANADGHPIHPTCKAPYGKRMGHMVVRLLYGPPCRYAFPTFDGGRTDGRQVILHFEGVSGSLQCAEGRIHGFTICGEDGIHLEAEAHILSWDTVAISHPSVEHPAGYSYAYALYNQRANLRDSLGNPVMPFSFDTVDDPQYTEPREWLYTDSLICFESCFEPALGGAGEVPLWTPGSIGRHGEAALDIHDGVRITYKTSRKDGFYMGLAPTLCTVGRQPHLETVSRLQVTVCNPDSREKVLVGMLVTTAAGRRYMLPVVEEGERSVSRTLPAESQVRCTIDLTEFRGCYLMREPKAPADLSDVTAAQVVWQDISEETGTLCLRDMSLER